MRPRRLQFLSNTIEHAINKLRRFRRGKLSRNFNRFIYNDCPRRLRKSDQLGNGAAKDVAIHCRHPIDPPIFRVILDQPVDFCAAILGNTKDVFREALHFAIDFTTALPKGFADLFRLLLAKISLVEHLKREFA